MIYTIREFNLEAFQEFSAVINNLKDGDKLSVFIDSGGGNIVVGDMYLHVINSLSNVEVIGCQLCSSAFTLFSRVNCKRILLKTAFGMIHHTAWDVPLGNNNVPRGDFAKFQHEFQSKQSMSYDWMTKKEKKVYDNGDDVWLDYDRLTEIFPNL